MKNVKEMGPLSGLIKEFGLSDIHIISPKLMNPHADEALRIAKELCLKLDIHLDNFDGYNTMPMYLYPRTSLERVVALTMVTNFLYYVDEAYERHARLEPNTEEDIYLRNVFGNIVPIMLQGQMPDDKHLLYDSALVIRNMLLPLTTEVWLKRFVISILQHLKSTTYSLDDVLKSKGGDPLDRFMELRRLDGGMYPTMDMNEVAHDIVLPDEIKYHPFVHHVETVTADIGCLMNDLFSYEKEVTRYGSRFNLVAVLEDYRNMSFSQAVHESVILVNQRTAQFLEAEQNIPDFGDKEINRMVRLYVEGLRYNIMATWYWQVDTDRYYSPTSPFPELRR